MCDEDCETCAFAIWDSGDDSVGMPSHVYDCSCQFIPFDVFDGVASLERVCPFWLEQYELEYQKLRCSNCNSSSTGIDNYQQDDDDIETVEVICKQCGHTERKNIYDLPMW